MKIFYVADLTEGSTSLDRMHSLQRLGHQVVPFDIIPYRAKHRVTISIQYHLKPRVMLQRLNDDIRRSVAQHGKFDYIWIDKGVWIFVDTVEYLREHATSLVHYTPDPGIMYFRSRHFIDSIPLYDHLVTTKDFELDLYRAHGAKNLIHVQQSYCPVRYRDPQPVSRFCADVGFVGRCEPHYLQQINHLHAIDKVAIFGTQWTKPSNRRLVNPAISVRDGVWRNDYVAALASFKISLGLLSKNYPEQHTTRSFEIPASGTFLLAERTPEHQALFEEGKEAEFFDGPEEMLSKVKFYLANDAARQSIANMGRRRCTRSGYDNDSVIGRVMNQTVKRP